MAQLDNLFPALPPGKYNGFTVYVRNGKAITRRSKNDRGNPSKTLVQSSARLRWNNVQRLWGAFPKEWKPRYQNRSIGSTNYNTFMSLNMHGTPIYLTKTEVKNYASVLVPLVVSHGILKEIAVANDGMGLASDVSVGTLTVDGNTTLGQLSKAIVENNRDYCSGDQLTFVVGKQTMEGDVPRAWFDCHTIEINPLSKQPLADAIGTSDGFEVRNGVLASHVFSGAATWVHSRPAAEGEMSVSTQRLWCENAELISRYTSPEALKRAADTYSKAKTEMLTPNPSEIETASKI